MSRLSVLVSRPRRTLAALATVLVAVGITAASGADFTATSANADTTFATGTLTIAQLQGGGQAVLVEHRRHAPRRPGPHRHRRHQEHRLAVRAPSSSSRGTVVDSDATYKLSTKLDLVVKDCGDFSSGTPTCDAGDTGRSTPARSRP